MDFVMSLFSRVSVSMGVLVALLASHTVSFAEVPGNVLAAAQPTQDQLPLVTGAVYQADYILDAGDEVTIEDASMGQQIGIHNKILSDGSLQLPLVGKVYVAGMTISELTDELNKLYKKYYVNPSMNVQIAFQRPMRLYVSGSVKVPGVFVRGENLRPTSTNGVTSGGAYSSGNQFYHVFLTDALLMAGGLKYNANVTDIRIIRQFPKPMTMHVNLMDLLSNSNINQDIALRDKDIIEVPEIPKETVVMDAQWNALMNTNVTLGVYKVSVLGSVNAPGSYEVTPQDSLLKVIASAGGFAQDANQNQVFILRANSTGQVFKKQIRMGDSKMMSAKPYQQTAMLLPDDVIFVDQSGGKAVRGFVSRTLTQATAATTFGIINHMIRKWDEDE